MDRGTVLLFVSMAFMAIIRGLKEDLPLFRNLKGAGRALALAVLVAAAGAVDMMANQGTTLAIAFQTVLKTAGPSVLLLVVEWVGSFGGGGGSASGGTSSLPRPSKAPTMPAAAIVAIFAVSVLAVGLLGEACQYAKPACDVVKVADQACDLLLVELPDGGGAEPVPKSEIQQLALRRKTMRLQLAPTDGGYRP